MTSAEPETGETGDADQLVRSQETLDEAKDAARDALGDSSETGDLDAPASEEGLEPEEDEVAPSPN